MRRSTGTTLIWSFVLLLLAGRISSAQDLASPLNVSLCDLYEHPEDYTGKMIKVRGGSVGNELRIEDILHDARSRPCSAYMGIIVVFPDHVKPIPGFDLLQDAALKKLEEALNHSGPIHIDATYAGRFDAVFAWRDHQRVRVGQGSEPGFGKKHEYDARIVLREVSDVWAEPLPRK